MDKRRTSFWILFSLTLSYAFLLVGNALGLISWMPPCFVKTVTGYSCFACGTNRSTVAMMQGDFDTALNVNPFALIIVPAFLLFLLYLVRNSKQNSYDH